MQFNRRSFLKGAATAAGASAFISGSAGAKPVHAKLDDRLELDGSLEEIVVTFRTNDRVTDLDRFDLVDGYYQFEVLPFGFTRATGEQVRQIARLQSVRRVTPNYELEYWNDDARKETGAESVAESLGYTGTHGHVAVIDTGIGAPHPDHRVNVVNNYEQVNPLDENTMWVDVGPADTDGNGHGTHVSGTIAGDGSAAEEYRGMAPTADLTVYSTGAAVLIVNSLGAFDHLLSEKQSGRTNAQAVNNSFGPIGGNGANWDPDDPTNVATFELYQAGILPVFAAGNCGPDGSSTCPRRGDNTQSNYSQAPWNLAVAATDDDRKVTGFSSRGRTEDYDGVVNYDRQTALENYAEYRRAIQPPGDDDDTEQFHAVAASGIAAPFVTETADEFTLVADPDVDIDANGYYVSATLTWDPSTGRGVPEPSEFEFRLEDGDGNVVVSDGSTFINRVRNEARLHIQRHLQMPDAEETYSLELFSSRTGGQYEVSGEVLAVESEGGVPDPERPYALYRPSIGAPGNSIWSTVTPEDQLALTRAGDGEQFYTTLSGTSMATPVVAGVVALLNDAHFQEHGEYPEVLEVIEALESTAEFDEAKGHTVHTIGKGFVDAEAALEALLATSDDEGDEDDEDGPDTPDRSDPPDDPGDGDDGQPDGAGGEEDDGPLDRRQRIQ